MTIASSKTLLAKKVEERRVQRRVKGELEAGPDGIRKIVLRNPWDDEVVYLDYDSETTAAHEFWLAQVGSELSVSDGTADAAASGAAGPSASAAAVANTPAANDGLAVLAFLKGESDTNDSPSSADDTAGEHENASESPAAAPVPVTPVKPAPPVAARPNVAASAPVPVVIPVAPKYAPPAKPAKPVKLDTTSAVSHSDASRAAASNGIPADDSQSLPIKAASAAIEPPVNNAPSSSAVADDPTVLASSTPRVITNMKQAPHPQTPSQVSSAFADEMISIFDSISTSSYMSKPGTNTPDLSSPAPQLAPKPKQQKAMPANDAPPAVALPVAPPIAPKPDNIRTKDAAHAETLHGTVASPAAATAPVSTPVEASYSSPSVASQSKPRLAQPTQQTPTKQSTSSADQKLSQTEQNGTSAPGTINIPQNSLKQVSINSATSAGSTLLAARRLPSSKRSPSITPIEARMSGPRSGPPSSPLPVPRSIADTEPNLVRESSVKSNTSNDAGNNGRSSTASSARYVYGASHASNATQSVLAQGRVNIPEVSRARSVSRNVDRGSAGYAADNYTPSLPSTPASGADKYMLMNEIANMESFFSDLKIDKPMPHLSVDHRSVSSQPGSEIASNRR